MNCVQALAIAAATIVFAENQLEPPASCSRAELAMWATKLDAMGWHALEATSVTLHAVGGCGIHERPANSERLTGACARL